MVFIVWPCNNFSPDVELLTSSFLKLFLFHDTWLSQFTSCYSNPTICPWLREAISYALVNQHVFFELI